MVQSIFSPAKIHFMKTIKTITLTLCSLSLFTVAQAQGLFSPSGFISASPVTTPRNTVVSNSTPNGGVLKVLDSNGAFGDNFWIGFCHGGNPGFTSDAYDRARVGVNILPGGPGRLFFTTGPQGFQAERMRIDEAGNVGIGTTSPTKRLHVVGNVEFDGLTSAAPSFLLGLNATNEVVKSTILTGTPSFMLGLNASNQVVKSTVPAGIGTGTPNNIPKWNASGSGLAASHVNDDGTTVTVTSAVITPDHNAALHAAQGSGQSMGLLSEATTGSGQNIGIKGLAKGGTDAYGGWFESNDGPINYGVYAVANDNTSSGTGINTAVNAVAYAAAGGFNYGVNILAYDASGTTTIYGLYSMLVNGNASSYAGYFDGNVYTTGSYMPSDLQLKKNIQPYTNALEKIALLKPKMYEYKTDEYKRMNLRKGDNIGFIAQDLEQVFPNFVKESIQPAVFDKDGNIVEKEIKFKAVDYISLVPVLTAAIQEQQTIITKLEDRIKKLETASPSGVGSNNSGTGAMLYQNTPNPFDNYTEIRYSLPQSYTNAKLLVFDMNGKQLRSIPLQGAGEGKTQLSSAELAAGMYLYSLVVDGKEIDTKRMILSGK